MMCQGMNEFLSVILTASDDSCSGGLGTRLLLDRSHALIMREDIPFCGDDHS